MPARQNRITRGDDYRRVVRTGRRVGGVNCIVHAVFRSPEMPARFGFIVSKAVGGAVVRNLVRRRLKTVAQRHLANGLTGVDVVIRALPASAEAPYAVLEQEVGRSLAKAQAKREGSRDRSSA